MDFICILSGDNFLSVPSDHNLSLKILNAISHKLHVSCVSWFESALRNYLGIISPEEYLVYFHTILPSENQPIETIHVAFGSKSLSFTALKALASVFSVLMNIVGVDKSLLTRLCTAFCISSTGNFSNLNNIYEKKDSCLLPFPMFSADSEAKIRKSTSSNNIRFLWSNEIESSLSSSKNSLSPMVHKMSSESSTLLFHAYLQLSYRSQCLFFVRHSSMPISPLFSVLASNFANSVYSSWEVKSPHSKKDLICLPCIAYRKQKPCPLSQVRSNSISRCSQCLLILVARLLREAFPFLSSDGVTSVLRTENYSLSWFSAFSPNGLVLASASFHRLSHEHQLAIASLAVDYLCQPFLSLSFSSSPIDPNSLFRSEMISFRMTSTYYEDVVLCAIGDGLCLMFSFPHLSNSICTNMAQKDQVKGSNSSPDTLLTAKGMLDYFQKDLSLKMKDFFFQQETLYTVYSKEGSLEKVEDLLCYSLAYRCFTLGHPQMPLSKGSHRKSEVTGFSQENPMPGFLRDRPLSVSSVRSFFLSEISSECCKVISCSNSSTRDALPSKFIEQLFNPFFFLDFAFYWDTDISELSIWNALLTDIRRYIGKEMENSSHKEYKQLKSVVLNEKISNLNQLIPWSGSLTCAMLLYGTSLLVETELSSLWYSTDSHLQKQLNITKEDKSVIGSSTAGIFLFGGLPQTDATCHIDNRKHTKSIYETKTTPNPQNTYVIGLHRHLWYSILASKVALNTRQVDDLSKFLPETLFLQYQGLASYILPRRFIGEDFFPQSIHVASNLNTKKRDSAENLILSGDSQNFSYMSHIEWKDICFNTSVLSSEEKIALPFRAWLSTKPPLKISVEICLYHYVSNDCDYNRSDFLVQDKNENVFFSVEKEVKDEYHIFFDILAAIHHIKAVIRS